MASTRIFDSFNTLPFGFTNKQFEDQIRKCPTTLQLFKDTLAKGEKQSKLFFKESKSHFTPASPPDADNVINTPPITNCSSTSPPSLNTCINNDNLNDNVNENNTNSLLIKIKPIEALVKILKCNDVLSIDQVLSTDLSNKCFIVENNVDHKTIGCNWKRKNNTSVKFNVYKNVETNDFSVKRTESVKHLISENEIKIPFILNNYNFVAVCGNNYFMHVFSTNKLKLIQFLGEKPNCSCISKHQQKSILNANKNLSPTALYLKHSDIFKNRQEISNLKNHLKNKCKIKCPLESKYKKT